jgi:uncharacterized protein (DUF433 family)
VWARLEAGEAGIGEARCPYCSRSSRPIGSRPAHEGARVVVDPDRNFGQATVVGGVRTDILAELVAAGEPLRSVASSYDLLVEDVQAAVSYERARVA